MLEAGDFVLTPHGRVHQECVYLIEDDDRQVVYSPCKHTPKDPKLLRPRGPSGWIESATFTPSEPLLSMSVKFNVPEPPSEREGSLIYLFPGAQDAWGKTILQPVLQWGHNGRFGGPHWTIASWHCTPEGHTWHSAHHKVHPGQTIIGTVQIPIDPVDGKKCCGPDSCDWVVEAKVEEEPEKCARLWVPGMKQLLLFLVGGALEAYSLPTGVPLQPGKDSCHLFPASETVFREITLHDLDGTPFTADWGKRYPQDVCGFGVHVGRAREKITLTYC